MIGRTLSLYLAGHFLRNVLLTFGLFYTLIAAVDLIDQTRRASRAEGGTSLDFLMISMARAGVLAENIWPFAALFGSMATLIILNRRLELVVARAAGVSAWRFLLPALATAAILGVASAALYNPLARMAEAAGKRLEAEVYRGAARNRGARRDFWLRTSGGDGSQVTHAALWRERGHELTGVSRYEFDKEHRLLRRIDAASFTLEKRRTGNVWRGTDVTVHENGASTALATLELAAFTTSERLSRASTQPDDVPFWSLRQEARAAEAAGQNPLPYATRLQALLSRPLIFAAMVLLAGTCCLRFARFGQAARPVALGIVAGFMLYIAAEVVLAFGRNGIVPPWMAAWGPALVATLAGASVLLHQEDG